MRRPAEHSTGRVAILALLVAGAVSVLALAPRLRATGAARLADRVPYPVADHWPPFHLTDRLTEFDPETQAVKYTAPYRVEWADRRHWRQTLLDQTGDLVIGGVEWEQDDGAAAIGADALPLPLPP